MFLKFSPLTRTSCTLENYLTDSHFTLKGATVHNSALFKYLTPYIATLLDHNSKSVSVEGKLIPVEYDLGLLTAYDQNPVEESALK